MAGENNKVVIVTGGSFGIGRCTASALKENGCIVYEFSRRNIPMEGVTHLSVDVTNEDAINAAVQQVIQKETKIDAVINCAGFGISGAVEFTSMEQAKAQFDVNFFGTVTVNKAVLPFLRRQGKGHIVNISSVAAVAHIPFQTFYSASKAAVSSYSYALPAISLLCTPYALREKKNQRIFVHIKCPASPMDFPDCKYDHQAADFQDDAVWGVIWLADK